MINKNHFRNHFTYIPKTAREKWHNVFLKKKKLKWEKKNTTISWSTLNWKFSLSNTLLNFSHAVNPTNHNGVASLISFLTARFQYSYDRDWIFAHALVSLRKLCAHALTLFTCFANIKFCIIITLNEPYYIDFF